MQTTQQPTAESSADVAEIVAACLAAIRAINPIGAILIFALGFASAAVGFFSAVVGLAAAAICLAFLGGLYLDRRQVETAAARVTPAAAALFSAQAAAIAKQAAAAIAARPTSPPPLPSSTAIVAPPAWPNASGLPGNLVVSQITLKQPTAAAAPKSPKSKVVKP